MGAAIGREVDRDCPVPEHAAEARAAEEEAEAECAKPTGLDYGPLGVAIGAGSLEERRAVVRQHFPGWTVDERGVWSREP